MVVDKSRINKILNFTLDLYAKCFVFFEPVDDLEHGVMDLVQVENEIHTFILNEYFMNVLADDGDDGLLLFETQQGIHSNRINKAVESD